MWVRAWGWMRITRPPASADGRARADPGCAILPRWPRWPRRSSRCRCPRPDRGLVLAVSTDDNAPLGRFGDFELLRDWKIEKEGAYAAREEISLHGTTIPRGGVVLLVLVRDGA